MEEKPTEGSQIKRKPCSAQKVSELKIKTGGV